MIEHSYETSWQPAPSGSADGCRQPLADHTGVCKTRFSAPSPRSSDMGSGRLSEGQHGRDDSSSRAALMRLGQGDARSTGERNRQHDPRLPRARRAGFFGYAARSWRVGAVRMGRRSVVEVLGQPARRRYGVRRVMLQAADS